MRTATAALLAALLVATTACDSTAPPRPGAIAAEGPLLYEGIVGQALAGPAVRVTTTGGQPVPGADVVFTVLSGGGSIASGTRRTNSAGVATLDGWMLGTQVGSNTARAQVAGVTEVVTFTANAKHGPVAKLGLAQQPAGGVYSGAPLPFVPTVDLLDEYDNRATSATATVTLELIAGDGSATALATAQTTAGRAAFAGVVIDGTGSHRLRFTSPGLAAVETVPFEISPPSECESGGVALPLNMAPGQFMRFTFAAAAAPGCLIFDQATAAGHRYLLLFENMPLTGSFIGAVYPGAQADSTFPLRLRSGAATTAGVQARMMPPVAAERDHGWDFGAGPIYEAHPEPPPASQLVPRLLRAGGLALNAATANPVVGDTISVYMEGIQRLGMPAGTQRAVVRLVSAELIIAEDVRLTTTLTRQGGDGTNRNTPLTQAQLDGIAAAYAANVRAQSDLLFDNHHNSSTSGQNGGRVIAIHSLMYADNIWGYTYPSGNYFVWDFWVGTNGSTAGANQNVLRVADNLFMHEIAHMRHYGLAQRAPGVNPASERGNRWVVEGFARFTERLPVATRILGGTQPSRTGNVVLPLNPAFAPAYFRDDVPTFLNAGSSMFEGYQTSSFVFDYFADQVALQGGDWLDAVRDLLVSAGNAQRLDAAVARWLPGMSFVELFTRARIALYADDLEAGLPAWTQYHQYQLRASRPAGSQSAADPRNAWSTIVPGRALDLATAVQSGGAVGFILNGADAGATSDVLHLTVPRRSNAVLSVTRLR